MSRRWPGVLLLFAAAGTVAVVAVASAATAAAPTWIKGPLLGNIPEVTIRGVPAGGLPWVVKGSASVVGNTLTAQGTWLVVPAGPDAAGKPAPKAAVGTTLGVKSVVAALSCAGAKPVVTAASPLSAKGVFTIHATVKVTAGCADPIILVGPAGPGGTIAAWFASTDFLVDYGTATPAMIKAWSAPAASTTKTTTTAATTTTTTTTSTSTWA